MKNVIACMLMSTLLATAGCNSQSSSLRGGGMTEDKGFKIAVPTRDTEIKQGEVSSVTVTLERGDFFKEAVDLQIQASEGISIYPTDIQVKGSDNPNVQLRIATNKDTALGSYLVSVKGTPKTGEPTSKAFTVKVVSP
ncbi:hypothetical protein ACFL6U_13240 [Planctomycetota bacterium]